MAVSPSTDNYTLGKGVVYFNRKNMTTGLYLGERDLGNAPAFTFNIALEKLEHYSSRGGLRAKDKEIISQISPGITFTLDEINKDNLSLLTLGDSVQVSQAAGFVDAEEVVAHLGLRSELEYRKVGSWILSHGAVTSGPFVVGTTVTSDNVDPGSGTIISVGTGQIGILIESGTFASDDTITASTVSADMTADPVWNPGVILVQDADDTITYTEYTVNTLLKDDQIGRIHFNTTGTITEGETVHVSYNRQAYAYTVIRAFNETQLEGRLRFVSDNPAGTQQELVIHRVSLAPSGDTAMIGEDWSTLAFTGEVLKDETNVNSPYMDIYMD
jgi:hypothetical protein